jgi:hypothetical protein
MSRIVLGLLMVVAPTGLALAQTPPNPPPYGYCPSEASCNAYLDDLAEYCRANQDDPFCFCNENTRGYKCYESSDSDSCWEYRCVDCIDTSDCGTCDSWVSENPCSAACGFRCCEVYVSVTTS